METPLGPSFANAFLSYYEKKNWLHSCPQRFKPVFYRRYVDDIFVLFKSNDYLKYFEEFLNVLFYRDRKKTKFSFLDVVVIHEQGKFTTRIYRISTFCGVYSNCEKFYPLFINVVWYTPQFIDVFVFAWTKFHTELTSLKRNFHKNGYPGNFIDKCFKKFLDNTHFVQKNVPTVEEKRLFLGLPYLEVLQLETRIKLQQAFKGVLNCCKLQIAF